MQPAFPGCVDQYVNANPDQPVSLEPLLAIIASSVLADLRADPLKLCCLIKRDTVHVNVARIFPWVEGNVHAFNVYALNTVALAPNRVASGRNARGPGEQARPFDHFHWIEISSFEAW